MLKISFIGSDSGSVLEARARWKTSSLDLYARSE